MNNQLEESDDYFTAEEDEREDEDTWCPDGFIYSTSPDGTIWILPSNETVIQAHQRIVGFNVKKKITKTVG